MSTNSFAHRRRSLLRVLLCVVLAAACDLAPPPTSPSPSPPPPPIPAPTPGTTQYRVSGVVMDAADAAPIASATVVLQHTDGQLTTRTGADGAYAFSLDPSQPYRHPFQIVPGDFLGLLITGVGAEKHQGGIGRGHSTTVQLLPWGTPDVVHNVRLRPVRTLAAGQSMGLSVEPDSSFSWNQEWDPWFSLSFDTVEEQFRVSVPTDGVLTIEARPEAGGNVAFLTCHHVCADSFRVRGTLSVPVKAVWSLVYFSVEIPRGTAPQRYEIHTSLR
jgi:hypothetical protein